MTIPRHLAVPQCLPADEVQPWHIQVLFEAENPVSCSDFLRHVNVSVAQNVLVVPIRCKSMCDESTELKPSDLWRR